MQDQTEFISKPQQIEVEFEGESRVGKQTGRFWIALLFTVGTIILAGIIVARAEVNVAMTVFTSFVGIAGVVIGQYMGQHKKQTQPEGTK